MNFHEGLSPRYCYPHFTAKDTVSKTNCSSFQGSQIIQVLGLVFAPKQHDSLIILYSFSIQTDTPANSDGCCYFYHLYCTLFFFFFFFCTSENPWSPIVGHFCGPFYPHLLLIHGVYHSILMRICQTRVLFRFSYFIRNNKRVFMALLLPRQKTRVIKQEPDSIETHYTILRTTIAP